MVMTMSEITIEQIDTTRDTGEPVFRAESDRAECIFVFPREADRDMIIHNIRSEERGGMSELLDHICRKYECSLLRFSTPLNDILYDRLHGFEEKSEMVDTTNGEMLWEYLDGEWQVDHDA